MSLKTITRWRCDKCNTSTQEPGKDALIPEGWGHVTITVRLPLEVNSKGYFDAMAGPQGIVHVNESGDITVEQTETKHYCKDCWHEDISPIL
jgi:ribosomal protein L37AE/L43A